MKKILFIEDEPHVSEIVSYRLQKAGYKVMKTADGTEGLALAKKGKPDLVLLDLNIPGLSGEEVCKHIKADKNLSKIPVMILTASADEIEKKAKNLGAEDFLLKPYEVADLLMKVKKFVGK